MEGETGRERLGTKGKERGSVLITGSAVGSVAGVSPPRYVNWSSDFCHIT